MESDILENLKSSIDETTGKYNNLDIVSPDCVLSDDYKLKINDLLFIPFTK